MKKYRNNEHLKERWYEYGFAIIIVNSEENKELLINHLFDTELTNMRGKLQLREILDLVITVNPRGSYWKNTELQYLDGLHIDKDKLLTEATSMGIDIEVFDSVEDDSLEDLFGYDLCFAWDNDHL